MDARIAGLGYGAAASIVSQPAVAGRDQFVVGPEERRLPVAREEPLRLVTGFVQHETGTSRDLHRATGLQVAIGLAQESEIDTRRVDCPRVVVVIDRPRL